MAATVEFTITVNGAGDVLLPVDFPDGNDVEIVDIGQETVAFVVGNILDRPVTINLEAVISGSAKDKISATVLQDSFTIDPGGEISNSLTVEASTALVEGDVATISVRGNEV